MELDNDKKLKNYHVSSLTNTGLQAIIVIIFLKSLCMNDLYEIMPHCLVPPCSVAGVARITTTKTTDVLALVKRAKGSVRKSKKEGEAISDFELIDNTERTPGKLASLTVSVFGIAKIDRLMANMCQSMVFLNLIDACTGSSTATNHYGSELLLDAPSFAKTNALQAAK